MKREDKEKADYIYAKGEVESQPYNDDGSEEGGNFGSPKRLYQEKHHEDRTRCSDYDGMRYILFDDLQTAKIREFL